MLTRITAPVNRKVKDQMIEIVMAANDDNFQDYAASGVQLHYNLGYNKIGYDANSQPVFCVVGQVSFIDPNNKTAQRLYHLDEIAYSAAFLHCRKCNMVFDPENFDTGDPCPNCG